MPARVVTFREFPGSRRLPGDVSRAAPRDRLLGRITWSSVAVAAVLGTVFVAIVDVTWARWGDVWVDCGGSLYQAAVLAQGGMLYRDVLCPYGPLGPYAVAAMFALFGIHLTVAYVTGLALLACESLLLWFIGRRLLSTPESIVALAAFWILEAFQPGLFGWILPNVFASTFGASFATATVALVIADRERCWDVLLVAASLCAALAGLGKVEHGAAALVTLLAYVLLVRPRHPACPTRGRGLALAVLPGFALVVAVSAPFLVAVPWRPLVFDNVFRVRSWAEPTANLNAYLFPSAWRLYGPPVLHYLVELPLRVALVELGLRRVEEHGLRRLAGIGLVLAMLALPLVPGYPWNPDLATDWWHQVQFAWTPPVWAAIALWTLVWSKRSDALSLVAIFSVAESARWRFRVAWCPYYAVLGAHLAMLVVRFVAGLVVRQRSCWPTVLVMSTWVAIGAASQWAWYAQEDASLHYPRGTITTTPGTALQLLGIVDFVRQNTHPGDYVAVMPGEQMINFLAETRQPTRDIGIGPGWLATPDDEIAYVLELEAKAPRYVIVSTRTYPESRVGRVLDWHRQIARFVAARYQEVRKLGAFTVFERRDGM